MVRVVRTARPMSSSGWRRSRWEQAEVTTRPESPVTGENGVAAAVSPGVVYVTRAESALVAAKVDDGREELSGLAATEYPVTSGAPDDMLAAMAWGGARSSRRRGGRGRPSQGPECGSRAWCQRRGRGVASRIGSVGREDRELRRW